MADDHGMADAHGDAAHGDGQGNDGHGGQAHDQAHDEAEALGPVDVTMWGAAVLGIALGLVVFIAFMQAVL